MCSGDHTEAGGVDGVDSGQVDDQLSVNALTQPVDRGIQLIANLRHGIAVESAVQS